MCCCCICLNVAVRRVLRGLCVRGDARDEVGVQTATRSVHRGDAAGGKGCHSYGSFSRWVAIVTGASAGGLP